VRSIQQQQLHPQQKWSIDLALITSTHRLKHTLPIFAGGGETSPLGIDLRVHMFRCKYIRPLSRRDDGGVTSAMREYQRDRTAKGLESTSGCLRLLARSLIRRGGAGGECE